MVYCIENASGTITGPSWSLNSRLPEIQIPKDLEPMLIMPKDDLEFLETG